MGQTNALPNSIDFVIGWSIGSQFSDMARRAGEVRQGVNYYMQAPFLSGIAACIGNVIYKMTEITPENWATKPIQWSCSIVPILTLPVNFLMAAVKHGHYSNVANFWNNRIDNTPIKFAKLPQSL